MSELLQDHPLCFGLRLMSLFCLFGLFQQTLVRRFKHLLRYKRIWQPAGKWHKALERKCIILHVISHYLLAEVATPVTACIYQSLPLSTTSVNKWQLYSSTPNLKFQFLKFSGNQMPLFKLFMVSFALFLPLFLPQPLFSFFPLHLRRSVKLTALNSDMWFNVGHSTHLTDITDRSLKNIVAFL